MSCSLSLIFVRAPLPVPVSPSPPLGTSVLPAEAAEEFFRPHYGKTLNQAAFMESIRKLNDWYRGQGYYGQVADISADQLDSNGVAIVRVVEAVVDKIHLKYDK